MEHIVQTIDPDTSILHGGTQRQHFVVMLQHHVGPGDKLLFLPLVP